MGLIESDQLKKNQNLQYQQNYKGEPDFEPAHGFEGGAPDAKEVVELKKPVHGLGRPKDFIRAGEKTFTIKDKDSVEIVLPGG